MRTAVEPWAGMDTGGFARAIRRAVDLLEADLRELVDVGRRRVHTVRAPEDAAVLFGELDGRLGALLDGLRDVGAGTALVTACEDASARCLHELAVHTFNEVVKGALPLRMVERALALAHAGSLREQFPP